LVEDVFRGFTMRFADKNSKNKPEPTLAYMRQ